MSVPASVLGVDKERISRYTYDEWGNITSITDGNGNDVSSNATHIANLNPLRYRSYFYDTETGWYWLNTNNMYATDQSITR